MELAHAVADYARSTEVLLDAARRASDDQWDRHRDGAWSARQIVHHVADSETQSYVRLRRLLAEPPGSVIQGYDEAAWAECRALGYRDLSVETPLRVFEAVRRASLDILERLSDADLERYGEHSESGRYTLGAWLEIYTRHPLDHADQLIEALSA